MHDTPYSSIHIRYQSSSQVARCYEENYGCPCPMPYGFGSGLGWTLLEFALIQLCTRDLGLITIHECNNSQYSQFSELDHVAGHGEGSIWGVMTKLSTKWSRKRIRKSPSVECCRIATTYNPIHTLTVHGYDKCEHSSVLGAEVLIKMFCVLIL